MEYWDIVKTFLIENWEIIFGIVGVIGTIFTICSFYLKHGYKLGYTEETTLPLSIDKKVEKDLKILYKNKPISLLIGKVFRVFNYGDKEIRKEDLYKSKLSINLGVGRILNIQLKCKEDNGNVQLKKINEKRYEIPFDYINANQIMEITVLYEGADLNIHCQAAGMEGLKKFSNIPSLKDLLYIIFMIAIISFSDFAFFSAEKVSLFKTIAIILFSLFDFGLILLFVYSFWVWIFAPRSKILNYKFPENELSKSSMDKDFAMAMKEYRLHKMREYRSYKYIIDDKI